MGLNTRMTKQSGAERLDQARRVADLAHEVEDPQVLRNLIGQMHGLIIVAEAEILTLQEVTP